MMALISERVLLAGIPYFGLLQLPQFECVNSLPDRTRGSNMDIDAKTLEQSNSPSTKPST